MLIVLYKFINIYNSKYVRFKHDYPSVFTSENCQYIYTSVLQNNYSKTHFSNYNIGHKIT